MATQVKKSKNLTLKDRLSRLTFKQACELLGGPIEGKKLLYAGEKIAVENLEEQVYLDGDLFRLSLPNEDVIVTITMRQDQVKRMLPWQDYVVTSKPSGKTYRVALRGSEPGDSYCTCPDYRSNTLGTCKHILHALPKIRRRFEPAAFKKKPKQKETSVYLKYGIDLALAKLLAFLRLSHECGGRL